MTTSRPKGPPAILAAAILLAGALPASRGAEPAGDRGGLHIPPGRTITFNHTLSDAKGYRWDIQNYGTVYQGTNYAYSNGLYLYVHGSNFYAGTGWANKAGDEVEIGPWNWQNQVHVHRRIKVYKDVPLARWLDIFENTSAGDVTVAVRVYTYTRANIQRVATSTGKSAFGPKDWALVTHSPSGNNPPALLHVVCGKHAKLRPRVQLQQAYVNVYYDLVVPRGKTAILCYFESQDFSFDGHVNALRRFSPQRYLRDLPAAVRKLIVNFADAAGGLPEDISFERQESADTVILRSGDPIYGTIGNDAFAIDAVFGKLTVPAARVLGMSGESALDEKVRVVLTDGQVVCGRLSGQRLRLTLPAGGTLQIPFERISQWSYRISKSRPEDVPFAGPFITLRSGDHLALAGESVKLTFQTRHGTVDLDGAHLLSLELDNPGHSVHRAVFRNGSRLAGFVGPKTIGAQLRLGLPLEVPREMVRRLVFAAEEEETLHVARAALTNGDELLGELVEAELAMETEYGPIHVKPTTVKAISLSQTHQGQGVLHLWDGSVLRGQMKQDEFTFQITPGPRLKLSLGHCVEIVRSHALPPQIIIDKVNRLVARLGAESYKDRQEATEALVKLGGGIVPLLRKHLHSKDPEVRQRVEDIIEKLGGWKDAAPPAAVYPHGPRFMRVCRPQ